MLHVVARNVLSRPVTRGRHPLPCGPRRRPPSGLGSIRYPCALALRHKYTHVRAGGMMGRGRESLQHPFWKPGVSVPAHDRKKLAGVGKGRGMQSLAHASWKPPVLFQRHNPSQKKIKRGSCNGCATPKRRRPAAKVWPYSIGGRVRNSQSSPPCKGLPWVRRFQRRSQRTACALSATTWCGSWCWGWPV